MESPPHSLAAAVDVVITCYDSPVSDGAITGYESPLSDGVITGYVSPASDGVISVDDWPVSMTRLSGCGDPA